MHRARDVIFASLKRSLIAGLCVLTAVGALAVWGLWTQHRSIEHLVHTTLRGMGSLSEVRKGLSRLEVVLLRLDLGLEGDFATASRVVRLVEGEFAELRGLELEGEVDALVAEFEVLKGRLAALASAGAGSAAAAPADIGAVTALARALDAKVEVLAKQFGQRSAAQGTETLEKVRRARLGVILGLFAGWFVLVGSLLFSLRRVHRPLRDILAFMEAAGAKDLTGRLQRTSEDELGVLAQAAGRIQDMLVSTLAALRRVVGEAEARGCSLGSRALETRRGAEDQLERVEAGGTKAREIEASLGPLATMARGLREGAEQAASSVQQILAMNEQVRAEMEGLCQRVGSSTGSMEELSDAIARVAALAGRVGGAAQSVAAAAAAIDAATDALSAGAGEGRSLSEDVVAKATEGGASMKEALKGMDRIQQAVDAAVHSFERLEGELMRVGRVTQVIDDIAARTNLLSLNAAIIAAQAGERGKAFGVVATEIRSLAEKTAASTREIRSIVEGVVSGGREAAKAVSEGAARVGEGAKLSEQTERLLRAMHESADRTAGRLREIEVAVLRQAEEAGRVAEDIRQVSQGVVDIVGAVKDQETRARSVHGDLVEIDLVARQTSSAMDEQNRGTELITQTVVEVSQTSEEVDGAIGRVTGLLTGLRADLEVLGARAREDLDRVAQLEVEGEGLASLAGEIHREVEAFRLPAAS